MQVPPPGAHIGVSVAVFTGNTSILLIQRGKEPNKGRWSFPGGRLNEGESLREAALRELEEETGVQETQLLIEQQPADHMLIQVGHPHPPYHIHVFRSFLTDAVTLRHGDDASDAKFFPLSCVAALNTTPGLSDVIDRLRTGERE